jgi:phage gp45-like
MVTFGDLDRVRRGLERLVGQSIAQIFGYTRIANASALGDSDAVEKEDDAADPDGQKGQRPVVRLHPFGFISRPPKGLRGLWLRIGSSNVAFIGIMPQQSYGPQNLNVGETAVFGSQQQNTLYDQNGNIIHTPTGTGTVQCGGTHPMPIWDSFTTAFNTFVGAVAGIATPVSTLLQCAGALNTIIAAALTLQTSMTTNTSYKSTIAQNG